MSASIEKNSRRNFRSLWRRMGEEVRPALFPKSRLVSTRRHSIRKELANLRKELGRTRGSDDDWKATDGTLNPCLRGLAMLRKGFFVLIALLLLPVAEATAQKQGKKDAVSESCRERVIASCRDRHIT